MKTITEKEREIKVFGEYDVAVCGGGIAGIASALAAARNGAKTLLIEKSVILGGLATSGLVTIYLPLCDGNGTQVSFGIAEELLRLSIKHGYEDRYPDAWLDGTDEKARKGQRFEVQYNAYVFAILCEQLLKDEGVEILYDTSICSADVENKRINNIVIENKSGRQAVIAKSFIDCTGDADICRYAGEKTALFSEKNILAAWYYYFSRDAVNLVMLGAKDLASEEEEKPLIDKRYTGVDGREISEMMQDSHSILLSHYLLNQGKIDGEHNLTTIASIPQLRKTRRLVGKYELSLSDDHKHIDNSVGIISDWRKPGPVYEIPFTSLYGEIKNLYAAGRCMSSTDGMWEYSRVIPACAVTGEACGTAAAIFDANDEADVKKLQEQLEKQGVKLHL